jgi:transcriptional regulator with XRE-family HTH domain
METKIKAARVAAGMTQKEAAEACGISLGVWKHYEQGSRSFDGAGLKTIIRAAVVFKCKIEDLIEDEEAIGLLNEYTKRK